MIAEKVSTVDGMKFACLRQSTVVCRVFFFCVLIAIVSAHAGNYPIAISKNLSSKNGQKQLCLKIPFN